MSKHPVKLTALQLFKCCTIKRSCESVTCHALCSSMYRRLSGVLTGNGEVVLSLCRSDRHIHYRGETLLHCCTETLTCSITIFAAPQILVALLFPTHYHQQAAQVEDRQASYRCSMRSPFPSQAELPYLGSGLEAFVVSARMFFHRPFRSNGRSTDIRQSQRR